MKDWSKEFAEFRTDNDMTQAQLARVLVICDKTVWNIEQGKTQPQMRVRLRFNALVKKYAEAKRVGKEIVE